MWLRCGPDGPHGPNVLPPQHRCWLVLHGLRPCGCAVGLMGRMGLMCCRHSTVVGWCCTGSARV
ncbi:MAG: hypothetical protein WC340_09725, partial [Kiritimatiellia bacterium]